MRAATHTGAWSVFSPLTENAYTRLQTFPQRPEVILHTSAAPQRTQIHEQHDGAEDGYQCAPQRSRVTGIDIVEALAECIEHTNGNATADE
jgi:hypothetical protein